MKTKLLLLSLLVSLTMSAQWHDSMYEQYTYENYTNYPAFNEPVVEGSVDIRLLEAAVFYESNRQRALNGVPLLKFDHALNMCARDHSDDMVKHNFFSHTSVVSGKESMSTRFALVGYVNCWCAENIASCEVKKSYAETGRYLVEELWMNSPGHRKNILNPKYTHLGAGISVYRDRYWLMLKATQNFVCK